MTTSEYRRPNSRQHIAKYLEMEDTVERISSDVKELINIVCSHRNELRELFEAVSCAASKTELFAAIATIRLQNLRGQPPSNALINIMGEQQKFWGPSGVVGNHEDNSQQSRYLLFPYFLLLICILWKDAQMNAADTQLKLKESLTRIGKVIRF